MHDVTLRTNVDAAKRLVNRFNDGISFRTNSVDNRPTHADFNPMVGDVVVIHRSYGKIIQMVVCGRTWDVTAMGTELEIELTTPPGMSITQFTEHVKDCGFPVHA